MNEEIEVDEHATPCSAYRDGRCTAYPVSGDCCYRQAYELIVRQLEKAEKETVQELGSVVVKKIMGVKGMKVP